MASVASSRPFSTPRDANKSCPAVRKAAPTTEAETKALASVGRKLDEIAFAISFWTAKRLETLLW